MDDTFFPKISSLQFKALGTEIELRIVVSNLQESLQAKKDLLDAQKLYEKFTVIFSRFDSDSELSRLNGKLNSYNLASTEIIEIVEHCLKFNTETLGFFDPRIINTLEAVGYKEDFKQGNFVLAENISENDKTSPLCDDLKVREGEVFFGSRMDFSGIAKGFITDKTSHFLMKSGWKNFFVDSGGDMYFLGKDQLGEAWKVDIEGIDYAKIMLVLNDRGIATSGISRRKWEIAGQRFHHIINPKNRQQFSFELKAVTVITESAEESDVWAKTLFLMGKEKGIEYAKSNSIPAVFLDYNGGAWISPEIKNFTY